MKQKFFIVGLIAIVALVLVGLNAASYTQKPSATESELYANRSTFNPGPTGTQAFYALLAETGRNVTRWQQPPAALFTTREAPSTLIMTGDLKRDVTAPESEELLRWVSNGGRLVVIDRTPPRELVTTTANWTVAVTANVTPEIMGVDSIDQTQMTNGTAAAKPVQPSSLTQSVNAIQTSRFASSIGFSRIEDDVERPYTSDLPAPTAAVSPSLHAPVTHFVVPIGRNVVATMPFGEGEIILLTDPYVVSNGGIALVDNAQLAVNLATAGGGLVAFDEFHQGFGNDRNRFLQFFAGTPVVALFLQGALLVGLVLLSQSRRFARPIPVPEPTRLSKLEYVAAMADLQRRTRAFDLAIENIYGDFRRRVARLVGLDATKTSLQEISGAIEARSGLNGAEVAATLHECEEIIRGEPATARDIMRLTERLREIESTLGLSRRPRGVA
jgi:hypothetical protein